ncbi:hypothetical protein LINPERPRIM_LOCUS11785 [Linum perenne]
MYTILFIYRFFYNLKFVSPESWNHVLATQTHSKIERRIYPHSHVLGRYEEVDLEMNASYLGGAIRSTHPNMLKFGCVVTTCRDIFGVHRHIVDFR